MAQNETWLKHDLLDAVKVQYLDGNLFSMDNAGNLIGVTLTRDGEDYSGGGSVSANVIRSDGGTVAVSGALSGNTATVVLPQAAYAVPGVVSIVVKLTASGQVTTIAALVANVYRSSTDTAVDPGTIIPSIQTLISQINTAVASIPADYSALWTKLAPAFSTDTSYVAGQYVTYNSGLYRFNTSHSGSWSSSDVTAVNLGGEISDLKSALGYTTEELQNNIFGLGYQETIISEYAQGDRSTSDPYNPTSNLYRITVAYPIRVHKFDTYKITVPAGKKVGTLTSTGVASGFKTADFTEMATGNYDVFIIMANNDTSTVITPEDGAESGLTFTYHDNSSRIYNLEVGQTRNEYLTIKLIDYDTLVTIPGYTVNDGRVYSSSNDTKRSNFIAVKSGTKIAYKLRGISSFNLISFYTDKSATNVSAPTYVTGIPGNSGNYVEGIFTAPQDGYIIFTNMIAYTESYIGCVGGLYTINKRLDVLEDELDIVDLTDKYILNFGDSLANGAGNNNQSYADMIASETNGTLADYSVSGTPFANYGQSDDYACVYNQVRQAAIDHASHDVAICFVEGAINDLKRNVLDLGTLSDNYDGTYAKNMIIGTAEYIFYTLKNTFPNAKIVFVMYHQMPLKTDNITYVQMHGREDQEHEAFIAVCNKWSIPIADVYSEGALNSNIQAMAETYFGVDAGEKFGRDVAHPNALGYRKFYVPLIKQKLELSTYE